MAYKGIDVSKHNGTINWTKVKNAGITFAMLRVGLSTSIDARFIEYYKGAKSAGIALGGYWFSYALNTTQAYAEADACASILKAYPLDLPVYFDFEDDTERYARNNGITYTVALRTEIHKAFCSRLKEKGFKVGIYANENYLKRLFNWSALSMYPLWLAKWTRYVTGDRVSGFTVNPDSVTTAYGKVDAWQFSDSGKINGISGDVDLDYWYGSLPNSKKTYPDSYTSNGLTFRRCKNFWIVYHDAKKSAANYGNYCNAGFFGNFKNKAGTIYTLPVANIVCDPWSIPSEGRSDVIPHLTNGKLYFSTSDAHTNQFKGKNVSTLIVPKTGSPYVADVQSAPKDCLYAISGVPTVRNGGDVDYYNYVKKQGWDESCMGAASRNWIGIRDGEIWIITGKTTTKNYIYGCEIWNKLKGEGFTDVLALDGGGSYYYADSGKVKKTSEDRRVNNLIIFS